MPEMAVASMPESALSRANPFPGLRPYGEEDATWFFGRSREINELLKRLRRLHFVAVVGASGSGKSSVVRAGVLPQVRDGYLDAEWRIAQFRPGERPIANLAEALEIEIESDRNYLLDTLHRGPNGLVRAIQAARLPHDGKVLILVDQFEELFQFAQRTGDSAQEEIKEFLKLLLTAANSEEVAVYVMVTMRLEWLNECASYVGLAEAINEGIYLVPQMRRQQFQQAILGPLEAADGSLTSALLDQMLNDLDNRTDQLPVLQHALLRLWVRKGTREPFDIAGYEAVGTFSNCLSAHAEEIFNELTDRQKQVAELLFRAITQVNKNRKMRRPRPVSDILRSTKATFAELEAVIVAFSKQGRSFLVTTQGELAAASIVDISHEALIRQWVRLSNWVDHEAEAQARLERLEEDAAEWDRDRAGQKACLYTGSRLVRIEELSSSDLSPTAAAFVKESERQRFWQLARQRGWIVMTIALLVGVTVFVSLERAQTARALAAAQAAKLKQAESDALAASLQVKKAQEFQANLVQQIGAANGNQSALAAIAQTIQAKRVYLQYQSGGTQVARMVQGQLQQRGFVVPSIDQVSPDRAPTQTQVRYFHAEDRSDAQRLVGLLKQMVPGNVVALSTSNPKDVVPTGQFEVWVAASFPNPVANAPPPSNDTKQEPTPVAPPYVQPAPTPVVVQGPTIHAKSFPNPVTQGRPTTLSWTTEHALEMQLEGIGKVALNGSMEVTPQQNTSYTFIAKGESGTSSTIVEEVVVKPAPSSAPAAAANAEPAGIKAALNNYKAAYESESVDLMREAWPTIPKARQKDLKTVFDQFNAIRLTLNCNDDEIHVLGETASVTCKETAVYTQKGKRTPEQTTTATFRLRKISGVWFVDAVQ